MCVYIYIYICICIHLSLYYIYIYIYICFFSFVRGEIKPQHESRDDPMGWWIGSRGGVEV